MRGRGKYGGGRGSFENQNSIEYILGEKGGCVGHCWSGRLSRDAEVGAVI